MGNINNKTYISRSAPDICGFRKVKIYRIINNKCYKETFIENICCRGYR